MMVMDFFFFFQAEDGIRDSSVTGVQTCALPISPGLRQVVAYAYEAGIRGRFNVGTSEPAGKIDWNFSLFRTDLDDDILNVPAANISTGFFRNIGSTRRQGIEANVSYRDEDWRLSADYGLVDATFQSPITLTSPNSPTAD